MPNTLTALGLTTATRQELLDFYTAQYQAIYGADINIGSDTPDGQEINLYLQSVLDVQDLLVAIYNNFDPDQAIGDVLDQRVAINGIQRQGGTYTITPITIVLSQSVNLFGLDQTTQPVFTVADDAGTLWLLQVTQLGLGAGTHSLNFRAASPGATLTIPNTITNQTTVVIGVLSVNNPTTFTTLGVNTESDANLRLRRQKSVSLASQGYLAGLLAALENINGVSSAFVYENTSSITNSDGVPGHSIWVIVAGSGADADIAQAIYTKRNAGCGMFGAVSFDITQVDGSIFTVFWDVVVDRNYSATFTVTPLDGVTPVNIAAIRLGLAEKMTAGVNQEVNVNAMATFVQEIDPNALVTDAGLSLGLIQMITPSAPPGSGSVVLNYAGNASAAIAWNDSAATIQSKIQAITGLGAATSTGTFATAVIVDLSAVGDVAGLIYATSNTFGVGLDFDEVYTPVLNSPAKNDQLILATTNIIIVPLQLSPALSNVLAGGTQNFTGLGGYGDYVYSIFVNNSGATIDPMTGAYTAGPTTGVADTVRATDVFKNFAAATVNVV